DIVEQRPPKMFVDRARKRRAYLTAGPYQGRILRVQDMMLDEICLSAVQQGVPVAFTSDPYAESPLGWNQRRNQTGILKILDITPKKRMIDIDESFNLYMNTYRMRGLNDPGVYKDDNATGVMITFGFGAVQIYGEYLTLLNISNDINKLETKKSSGGALTDSEQQRLDTAYASLNEHSPADTALFSARAVEILDTTIARYPEFWMSYILLSEFYTERNDTATALEYLYTGEKNLQDFHDHSPDNANYLQDLGLMKFEIAKILGDEDDAGRMDESLELLWAGFEVNENSGIAYQKLVQYLFDRRRNSDILTATRRHAAYGMNRSNPTVQSILRNSVGG
ncbi:MAG: hypothetical protein ACE5GA_09480, partial [Candidatus Zixiibacteriota bacterium]